MYQTNAYAAQSATSSLSPLEIPRRALTERDV